MDALSITVIAATAWWALVWIVRAATVVATFLNPLVRRRAAVRTDRPAVSVVIPVSRMEPDVDAAFASVFSQAYPRLEVLISSAEEESEVIEAGRAVARRFPDVPARYLLGNERTTLNPKISNVGPAIRAAANDLVLVKDSSAWLADGQLAELVRNLTPGTGMVCAVPIGMRPGTFYAEIGCAMTNAHAAPWLLAGSLLRLDIGLGKVMLFDRRDWERVDGMGVMASSFGDDHALAKALARVRLRTVLSGGVVRQVIGRRTLREVWDRQLRWMVIRRDESPFAFLAEPFFSAGFATLAAALAGPALGMAGWAMASATMALWLASDMLVVVAHGWGWSWRFPLACICREPMLVGLWLRTWSSRKVSWAGRRYDLRIPVAQRGTTWTATASGEIPPELPLWPPAGATASADKIIERGKSRPDRSLRNVSVATLTAFLPPAERATGAAAVICPGGGYSAITIDREGYDVARWLATMGIAGLVLKYRLPRPKMTRGETPWPLQDVTRALDMTREHAAEWHIDTRRIGAMGFSAGGHMAAYAASVDRDLAFAVLVYPVISMEPDLTHKGARVSLLGARPDVGMTERYSLDRRVTAQTAPTLLVHARDDDVVNIANSERYADALRRAGVPHDCLFHPRGGHGFGLGLPGGGTADWPSRCLLWLQSRGVLAAPGVAPR